MPVATNEERESAFNYVIVQADATGDESREEIKRVVGKSVLRSAEHILLFHPLMVMVSVQFVNARKECAYLHVTRKRRQA